ncbi:MAG: hypothetical protein QS748_06775 [Candidatus Endonucleobacter bathymodioli]|uniref:Uncharacterized protein n=1 Tax=Candidatus Endonucleibacter bathymodioli TaxID=539814 RepID=A0AA90NLL3_9GAMM|nr:hypothetical protein [Candidatus Endonucleobacter bathymodioli]
MKLVYKFLISYLFVSGICHGSEYYILSKKYEITITTPGKLPLWNAIIICPVNETGYTHGIHIEKEVLIRIRNRHNITLWNNTITNARSHCIFCSCLYDVINYAVSFNVPYRHFCKLNFDDYVHTRANNVSLPIVADSLPNIAISPQYVTESFIDETGLVVENSRPNTIMFIRDTNNTILFQGLEPLNIYINLAYKRCPSWIQIDDLNITNIDQLIVYICHIRRKYNQLRNNNSATSEKEVALFNKFQNRS